MLVTLSKLLVMVLVKEMSVFKNSNCDCQSPVSFLIEISAVILRNKIPYNLSIIGLFLVSELEVGTCM